MNNLRFILSTRTVNQTHRELKVFVESKVSLAVRAKVEQSIWEVIRRSSSRRPNSVEQLW